MNKSAKFGKSDFKNKKTNTNNYYYEDETYVSLKEVKREKQQKHYRNYENALRSKNVDRLLSYEDD